jgi:phage shock protein A
MGIFSRLSDIVNSNLNALLDRAEDPEKLIRLVIQEMEDTLVEVRSSAARTIADKKEINRRLARLADAQAEWDRKAALALRKDREDLAKVALLEKARLAETAAALEEELEILNDALARGDADIAKLEAKLTEAKTKQKALAARYNTTNDRLKVRRKLYDPRVDEAFARFEQVERRLDDVEGRVEAYDLGQKKTLADEIAELEAESAIANELEALKARVAAEKAAEGTGGKA